MMPKSMIFLPQNNSSIDEIEQNANILEVYQDSFDYEQKSRHPIKENQITYQTVLSSQRDNLANVLVMEAVTTMCLVLASHRGSVSLVSGSSLSTKIGPSYILPVVPGNKKPTIARARGSSWLCDAAVMQDAKAIVYALSDRSLHFYDTACSLRSDTVQEHRHLWRVVGLPHSVSCLTYYQGAPNDSSMLFLGDEQGSITILTFLQPLTVLFKRRGLEARSGQAESVYWPEILKNGGPHSQHVTVKVDKKVHTEAVLQMIYCDEQQTIISCSLDTKKSLILRHLTGKIPVYVFNLDEGIRCFAFNSQHHQIASGSDDGIVRLWNPLVPTRPVACLAGHGAAIVDVLFANCQNLVISLCRFAELRLWNTRHHYSVQFINLSQPLTQNWSGTRSLFLWHGDDNGVLVALGPKLAEIPFTITSPQDSTSSSYESDNDYSQQTDCKKLIKPNGVELKAAWQDQQVKSLVDEAKDTSICADMTSGTTSECPTTSPSPRDDHESLIDKKIKIPEFQLNLNEFDSVAFKKPKFPPSAIEVINFSDTLDTTCNAPGMNERIENQERILSQKRQLVEQCAPHLALTLWPPATINIPNSQLTTTSTEK